MELVANHTMSFLSSPCVHERFFAGKIISHYLLRRKIDLKYSIMLIDQATLCRNLDVPEYVLDHLFRMHDLIADGRKVHF